MQKIQALVKQSAKSTAGVLITGESGVGKEVVAQSIHYLSDRNPHPFIAVNCAAIPENLIESELFGHKKGAFTGATDTVKGRFSAADKGSLFLDEIGDMPLAVQAKLLRVIQDKKITPLGGHETIDSDARIICATNKDLKKECKESRFRSDLFYRINVIPIFIPPLRDHCEDIPVLLTHFLNQISPEKADSLVFDNAALEKLCQYHFPGNVRELMNIAQRIVFMHEGNRVGIDDIQSYITANDPKLNQEPLSPILDLPYNEAKNAFEKQYLSYQYQKNGGVIAKTAEAIGVYAGNLHSKLKKHHILSKDKH